MNGAIGNPECLYNYLNGAINLEWFAGIKKEDDDTSRNYENKIESIITEMSRKAIDSAKLLRELMQVAIEFDDDDLKTSLKEYANHSREADEMMLKIIGQLTDRRKYT